MYSPPFGKKAYELHSCILNRERNRFTFLRKYVVSDEETGVPFNSSRGQQLAGVGSFNPEIDDNTQIKFCGSEHIPDK